MLYNADIRTMHSPSPAPGPIRRCGETRYPAQYSVCISQEVTDALEALCDAHETAMGVLLRRVIDRGLPPPRVAMASGRP